MTSKVLVLFLVVATVFCQQDDDDGSYSPEKYETPYENSINDDTTSNQVPSQLPPAFQQPARSQPVALPQQPSYFTPQNALSSQQPTVQNYYQQNPFFQQIPAFQRQQVPASQINQQVPQVPSYNSLPLQVQQRSQSFQPQPSAPAVRQPAPVNQPLDDGTPLTSTNYRTDDGHQRSEVVDNNGNVQGQYSYVDPNGKTITVRYSAGKDGYRVEGDHIPKVPQQQPVEQPQVDLQARNPYFSNVQPQVARFRSQPSFSSVAPQQFINPQQPRSQFAAFMPQYQLNPQQRHLPVHQASPYGFQPDGAYELQSSYQ